jgi:hypothetical protein
MLKTTVYLDSDTALALRQLAEVQGRPQAELIREALTRFTRSAAVSKPKGIGRYRSGRSDISERARKLLRGAVKQRRWP